MSAWAAEVSAAVASPTLVWTLSRLARVRSTAEIPWLGGSLFQSDQVIWSASAPLMASHSRSATTATRFPFLTTRAPGTAGEKPPTETTVEPIAFGWTTRAWSIPGTRTSCT